MASYASNALFWNFIHLLPSTISNSQGKREIVRKNENWTKIADSKLLKPGESKGRGFEFEITVNSK